MAWTPPTSKWKTNLWWPEDCGNVSTGGVGPDQCKIRQRFDALADPRVVTVAGFEQVCADHFDAADPPVVGEIELFTGEWMRFREWHAYESAFYSWVVYHEIGERTDVSLADRIEMQGKQVERGIRVSNGVPNLDRTTTDDGPWKPVAAITNPSAAQRAAVTRIAGWAQTDGLLRSRITAELTDRGGDREAILYWWEGSGGSRVLHVDTQGQLTPPQRSQIDQVIDLVFGPGRLVWEG